MESNFLEVEVLSYSKPGQPPRPVSFRFMMGEEIFKGKVLKVKDMKLDNRMGNKIFEYLCDAVIEGNGSTVKIGYEYSAKSEPLNPLYRATRYDGESHWHS